MSNATPFFVVSDPAATVLIDLSARGVAKAFGLRPNAGDTVTVGSDSRADLPLAGVGVAPLQFHLERRSGVVWLRPADVVGEMLLNGVRVTGPVRLEQRCVIEFGDVRVEARILDAGKDCGAETERFAPYAASSVSQQTERMAPYRPSSGAPAEHETSPALTANGTEIMAPVRGGPHTTPLAALASAQPSTPLLVHSAPSLFSQKQASGDAEPPRPICRHAAPTSKHSPMAQRWYSGYGPPNSVVETARPPARRSLLESIGEFAKARPLVVCGGAIGALVLAGILLVVARSTVHRESELPDGRKTMPMLGLTSQRSTVAAAPTSVETSESTAKLPFVGAKSTAQPSAFLATSSEPNLADAVSAAIAGRYDDARASYVALSQRIDSPQDYATIARLLDRMTDPECSDGTRAAPTSCPQILR